MIKILKHGLKKNKFEINQIIKYPHKLKIRKVVYYSNKNLISCSFDKTIKIWEEKNNNYQNIITLIDTDKVISILLLVDKNILISCRKNGVKFWNLNKYEFTINFDNIIINGKIVYVELVKIKLLLEQIQLK